MVPDTFASAHLCLSRFSLATKSPSVMQFGVCHVIQRGDYRASYRAVQVSFGRNSKTRSSRTFPRFTWRKSISNVR